MRSCRCHGTSLPLTVAPGGIFKNFSAQDNAKFVSSGGDKTLFYSDVSTGQTIRRIAAHNGKIPAVSLNEDASVVVSGKHEDKLKFFVYSSYVSHIGSFDTNVKIWDLK